MLDLTRVLAGPPCTMVLGDMGADILKIERPDGGEETRGWGPPFDPDGESAYHLCVNRNTLSAALDLDDPADHALVATLLAPSSEVLAEHCGSALTGMPPSVPGTVRRRPPRLGAHTAIVRAHGWESFGLVM